MAGVLAWISQSGVVQGVIIGAVLAFLTATLTMNAVGRRITTTGNGWSAIRACGKPGKRAYEGEDGAGAAARIIAHNLAN